MQLLKNIVRQLWQHVGVLPAESRTMAKQFGMSTFDKTRFSSHLGFIRRCLNMKVIPSGFKINRAPNGLPNHLANRSSRAMLTCSRRLMRTAAQHFNVRVTTASNNRTNAIEILSNQVDDTSLSNLRRVVHGLNKELYLSLKTTKEKKLKDLLPTPISDEDVNHLVTTIPDDLDVSITAKRVLAKGVGFIKTPQSYDKTTALNNCDRFYRRVKLHAHFNNPEAAFIAPAEPLDDPFQKFNRKPSEWTPATVPAAIETFINRCKEEIRQVNFKSKSRQNNFTDEEEEAYNALKKREDIIIKVADKGGRIVVWRKDLYLEELYRQLLDQNFYTKCESDLTLSNNAKISETIADEISQGNLPPSATNLVQTNPRCAKFYLLPKIHKANNPGRPIVSACNCPTEHVSCYLDELLQPFVHNLPNYVRDTTDVLRKLHEFRFSAGKPLIFTMDVKSLYTVIPHRDGLLALKHFFDNRPSPDPPTATLLRLAEMVLTLNHFEVNGDHFNQTRGVSMGTKMGPSYACLFLGFLEKQFHESYDGPQPELDIRYIDDMFGGTTMSASDLQRYIMAFNDYHPAVEVTHNISETSETFLDLEVYIENDQIKTTIHYKPTDAHAYLRYDSHHPEACKNSIPYSQLLRLRRICATEDNFLREAQVMMDFFLKRGYPKAIVQEARDKVRYLNRQDTLMQSDSTVATKIPLVLTFHPVSKKIASIVQKNARLLARDEEVGTLFKNNILTCFKNPPNLGKGLIRSSLARDDAEIPGTFPCNRPRCKTCEHTVNTDTVSGSTGSFNVHKSFSCISTNVIYCILCMKCPGSIYIGETGRMLGRRFREHVGDIRHNRPHSEVARHFNLPNHNLDDIGIVGLTTQPNLIQRRTTEAHLVRTLGTVYPNGMNKEEDSLFRTVV